MSATRRGVPQVAELALAELSGEILLELGWPRDAAAEFERALERWSNRSLTLLELARAAAARGIATPPAVTTGACSSTGGAPTPGFRS